MITYGGAYLADCLRDVNFDQEVERLSKQDVIPTDVETLRQAAKSLNYAIRDLDEAADSVSEGCERLADCVEYDRVKSILDEMEDMLVNLKSMRDAWEKGVI